MQALIRRNLMAGDFLLRMTIDRLGIEPGYVVFEANKRYNVISRSDGVVDVETTLNGRTVSFLLRVGKECDLVPTPTTRC